MKIKDQVILLAAAGIVLIGGAVSGFALQGGGAKAGREYIGEELQAQSGKNSKAVSSTAGSAAEGEPGQGIRIEVQGMGTGKEQEEFERDQRADGGEPQGTEEQSESDKESQQESEGDSESDKTPRNSGEIVMLFAGDVYLSDHVLNAYDNAGGIHGVLDEGIREEIKKADIFMVNQEFPFTERGTAAQDKQFTFRVPEKRMVLMKEMGIDIVTLANNHILDFGEEGLLDSCKALDEAEILYVGGGKDFERASALKTMVIGDKTIGFLGTSRVYMDVSWAAGVSHPGVFSTYDTTWPLKVIKKAREECDFLVVYVHWGTEKKETPEDYQKAMGRAYIDAGADLVVGSHPHVLQEIEEYKGKTIVYSLGNFVFGSSIPETALLKVIWGYDGTEISLIPCTSSKGFTRMAP